MNIVNKEIKMPKTKTDLEKREMLLFNEHYEVGRYIGGCRKFFEISLDALKELIAEGFLNPCSAQNDSPSAEDFLSYAEGHPNCVFVFSGYATSRDSDTIVVVDAITQRTVDKFNSVFDIQEIIDFVDNFRDASEFSVSDTECYAWWD